MLQRVQTVYLLAATVLMSLMLFLPLAEIAAEGTGIYQVLSKGWYIMSEETAELAMATWPVFILALVLALTMFGLGITPCLHGVFQLRLAHAELARDGLPAIAAAAQSECLAQRLAGMGGDVGGQSDVSCRIMVGAQGTHVAEWHTPVASKDDQQANCCPVDPHHSPGALFLNLPFLMFMECMSCPFASSKIRWAFQNCLQFRQKLSAERAVDRAMVTRQRDTHHPGCLDVISTRDNAFFADSQGEDGSLRRVDDRLKFSDAVHAQVGYGTGTSVKVLSLQGSIAGTFTQCHRFLRKLNDRQGIYYQGGADHLIQGNIIHYNGQVTDVYGIHTDTVVDSMIVGNEIYDHDNGVGTGAIYLS